MRFISLKSVICHGFADLLNSELLGDNKVVFLTPAGLVIGSPATKEISEHETTLSAYKGMLDGAIKIFDQELERSGNSQAPHDGYILLKDVEIRPYGQGSTIRLEALVLFTGEIAGVFLASKQSFQN